MNVWLTYILLVIFILLAFLVCHDDADPQGVKDGVVSVGVIWEEGKAANQLLKTNSYSSSDEQNWTHLDLVGRCRTRGSCRLSGSLVAEINRCRRWSFSGNMRLSSFGKHCVIRIQQKDSQFCRSTFGILRRTDTNGGCWSCSFYTLKQTCCSLRKRKTTELTDKWVHTQDNTGRFGYRAAVVVVYCCCWVTYGLSCERRRRRTWASCSSGP